MNSGTAVWLIGATWKYGWKNITNQDPVPGKYDIVEVDEGGWENPAITITGTIDHESSDSNEITEVLLKTFARAYTTQTYLSIGSGLDTTPTPLSKSDASVSETVKGGKTGVWIPIVIKAFNLTPAGESGHIFNYQVTITEELE